MSRQQQQVLHVTQAPVGDRGTHNPAMIMDNSDTRVAGYPPPYPTQQQPYPTQKTPYPTQQSPGTFAVYQPGQQHPAGSAAAVEAGVAPGPVMQEERSGGCTKKKVAVAVGALVLGIAIGVLANINKIINLTKTYGY
ncbi:hypothetical protein Bbelb_409650 [Branchiostoma belcheri]|nr:hypothetical protein Bbelb_409650 [Branchiostoma belcheri]